VAAIGRRIRIRMYRVGFGDCFLLTFPGQPQRHVLIDCGVHTSGDIKTLKLAVDDIARETKRKLALLIASHAHEDHIAGYARHGDVFATFNIGEIWLPWSENLGDAVAADMRRKFAALYARLQSHFAVSPPSEAAAAAMTNLTSKRNAEALANLRAGFGTSAKIQYLEAGTRYSDTAGIPGLTARILGPSRNEDFLKKMNPPKAERYLRMGAGGSIEPANAVRPFGARSERHSEDPGPRLAPKDETELQERAKTDGEGLAFTLDDAVNNSSVAVLFTYRGEHLLFPGDAQWGNWKFWIEADGGKELLAGLRFYKVAHHGSHNATPRSALEEMPDGFAAMCSTQSKPWPSIPQVKLMTRLSEKTGNRAVRSDSLPWPDSPDGPPLDRLPRGFHRGSFWIDYMVTLTAI
jgi:beta-lactamase superfamily II metal-dependent hydrolase